MIPSNNSYLKIQKKIRGYQCGHLYWVGTIFLFIKGMLARSQKPRLKPRMITSLLMIKQLGIILGPGKVTKSAHD